MKSGLTSRQPTVWRDLLNIQQLACPHVALQKSSPHRKTGGFKLGDSSTLELPEVAFLSPIFFLRLTASIPCAKLTRLRPVSPLNESLIRTLHQTAA